MNFRELVEEVPHELVRRDLGTNDFQVTTCYKSIWDTAKKAFGSKFEWTLYVSRLSLSFKDSKLRQSITVTSARPENILLRLRLMLDAEFEAQAQEEEALAAASELPSLQAAAKGGNDAQS